MTSAIHDHYFINYGLIGGAEYGKNGELRLRHRGNVFGILRQGLFLFYFINQTFNLENVVAHKFQE